MVHSSSSGDLTDETGDRFVIDNSDKTFMQKVYNASMDGLTVWIGESNFKTWIRVWLCVLMTGMMCSLAFLPHPFAIANLVAMALIMIGNGCELIRVRGLNKNMGWPHLVGWIPVLVVNILSLATDLIGGDDYGQITWSNAEGNAYEQARFVCLWINTIILGISCAFDSVDTVLYYVSDVKTIERSRWTVNELEKEAADQKSASVVYKATTEMESAAAVHKEELDQTQEQNLEEIES